MTTFWETLLVKSISDLNASRVPAVLVIATNPNNVAGLAGEDVALGMARSRGLYFFKFTEKEQINYMLSHVPNLPVDQLLACRKGSWRPEDFPKE